MFCLICFSGLESSIPQSVFVLESCKTVADALAQAYLYGTDFTVGDVIVVWNLEDDCLVARLVLG